MEYVLYGTEYDTTASEEDSGSMDGGNIGFDCGLPVTEAPCEWDACPLLDSDAT
jgi:hypothetical protein